MSNFVFDTSIIYPKDPTATEKRIEEYKEYYKIKYKICKHFKPKVIAEIGVRAGYSAWTFLQASPKAHYVGFDANNGTHGGQGGEDGRFAAWANKILEPYDYSLYYIDTQNTNILPIKDVDFFHVDGDHSVKGVQHDLDLAYNVLSEKGVILIDDITYIQEVKTGVTAWLSKMKNKVSNKFIPSLRGEMLIFKV